MHPRILWELVTDPLESGEHTLATAAVEDARINLVTKTTKNYFFTVTTILLTLMLINHIDKS
jgi:hypothetical protein